METGIVGDRVQIYQILGSVYRIADMMRCNADPGVFLVSENAKKLMKTKKFKETGAYRYKPSVQLQRPRVLGIESHGITF
jgi:hypothetical protein